MVLPRRFKAENCPKSCSDGVPRRFQAEKGVFSCAERDTNRLPGRKMPQILLGWCSEAVQAEKGIFSRCGTPKDKDNHLVCKNCRYFLFLRPKNKERRQRVIEVQVGRGCGT